MGKSADRVFHILEAIGLSQDGETHDELGSHLSIPKRSLSSLLGNFVDREYLSLNETDRPYVLGPHVLVLAGRYLSSSDMIRPGQPVIKQVIASDNLPRLASKITRMSEMRTRST